MKRVFGYHKNLIVLGGVLGLLAVIFGAYGTHGLAPQIDDATLRAFETAVKFQIYHALLALITGTLGFISEKAARLIFFLLLIGVLFFCGSIYGLATSHITDFPYARVAYITPLGGLFLMAAWVVLIVKATGIRKK